MNPRRFLFLLGLSAILLGFTPSSRATSIMAGDSGVLGQDQFVHPESLSFAMVDLLAGHPYTTLSVLKVTASGKVLLGGQAVVSQESDPASRPVGYIWDKGALTEILSPTWPWIYGDAGTEAAMTFTVSDMNDDGTVVGECAGGVRGPNGSLYSEQICILWPAGSPASPKELNPGVATPAGRVNSLHSSWFRNPRIDGAGVCYGVGTLGKNYTDVEAYFEDVVRWTDPDTAPENLTDNIDTYPILNTSSKLLDLSTTGNLLLSTYEDFSESETYEALLADPSGVFSPSPTDGASPWKITDTGKVVGKTSDKIYLWDSSRLPDQISGLYRGIGSQGNIVCLHSRTLLPLLWLWQPTQSGVDAYVPRGITSSQNLLLSNMMQSGIRTGSEGAFAGIGSLSTDFQGTPFPTGQNYRPLLFIPASLAVDADRDGSITDRDMSLNSQATPFGFWPNDDDDDQWVDSSIPMVYDEWEQDDRDITNPNMEDWRDRRIDDTRDMEDLARLRIYFGGLNDAIASGNIKIGLKWTDVSRGTPAIKLHNSIEEDGGTGYLFNPTVAADQYARDYAAISDARYSDPDNNLIEGSSVFVLPRYIFQHPAYQNYRDTAHLLFEGCKTGAGQLKLVILNQNDQEIGEGPGVWMDIKQPHEFIERFSCGDAHLGDVVPVYRHAGSTDFRPRLNFTRNFLAIIGQKEARRCEQFAPELGLQEKCKKSTSPNYRNYIAKSDSL